MYTVGFSHRFGRLVEAISCFQFVLIVFIKRIGRIAVSHDAARKGVKINNSVFSVSI